ncbi:DUF1206 domain-containing protein [Actinospongicola halichondriae]|uniref:DUF1206 domain-containing protein n=1 Tax=Actinospongicola halichondriae TaxID=3236844 RepID=UPI003D42E85F
MGTDQLTDTDEEDVAERAGQAGLAVRGVLYLVSALLTVRIAFGSSSDEEGPGKKGALESVAQQSFGRIALVVLAVGLAGYAVWRFIAAWKYDGDGDDSELKVWRKRIAYVGRGLVYVAAFTTAVSLILDSDTGSEQSNKGESGDDIERVFDLPAGRWIVLAIGLGVLAAAVYNGYRALSGKYREKWEDDMSRTERRWAIVVSEMGLVGHMAVFGLIGFFLTRAAIEYDPDEPESLDQAVRALADTSFGTTALLALAAGMVAYAAFSFVEARWRVLVE